MFGSEDKSFVTRSGDLYLKTYLPGQEDHIQLVVLSGMTAYKCRIDRDQLTEVETKLAGKLDSSLQDMVMKTFCQNSAETGGHFSLTVESEGDSKLLVWRKLGGRAKLRLAQYTLDLAEDFASCQADIFDFIMKDRLSLTADLAESKKQLDKTCAELERATKLARELQEEQEAREEELINQFLPILNSKKRRIAELEDLVRYNSPVAGHSRNNKEGEDVYGADTDDEDGGDVYKADTDEDLTDADVSQDQVDDGDRGKRKSSNSNGEPRKLSRLDYSESFEEKLFDDI